MCNAAHALSMTFAMRHPSQSEGGFQVSKAINDHDLMLATLAKCWAGAMSRFLIFAWRLPYPHFEGASSVTTLINSESYRTGRAVAVPCHMHLLVLVSVGEGPLSRTIPDKV